MIAYAIKNKEGAIDATTIGPTAQSAMVNFLYTTANVPVPNSWQYAMIEKKFYDVKAHYGVECIQVTVEENTT